MQICRKVKDAWKKKENCAHSNRQTKICSTRSVCVRRARTAHKSKYTAIAVQAKRNKGKNTLSKMRKKNEEKENYELHKFQRSRQPPPSTFIFATFGRYWFAFAVAATATAVRCVFFARFILPCANALWKYDFVNSLLPATV